MSSIVVSGDVSGSVTLSAPSAAGSVVVTLPSASGTMAVTGGSPSFTNLTVTGDITLSGTTNKVLFSNAGGYDFSIQQQSGNYLGFYSPENSASPAMVMYNNGKIGIGTTAPQHELQVTGANPRVYIRSSSTGYSVNQYQNDNNTFWVGVDDNTGSGYNGVANAAILYNNGATPMIFTTSASERMRIDASGKWYLATTSSNYNSFANIDFTGFGNCLDTKWTGTNSIYHLLCTNGNGLVGGVVSSGSTTSFVTSSDYRLKENIAPMQNALNVVQQLKPVTYKWKADGSDGQGFIAHELAEIIPDAVSGEKDAVNEDGTPKYQGIDTSFLVATLTAAIQELNAKVTALEAQLAGAK